MIIMSVDLGDARTGIACCDRGEMLASPACTINESYIENILKKVAELAAEKKAEQIIVGLPLNMNGTRGPRADLCEEFARRLGEMVEVPVKLWDERSTTVTAIGYLNQTNTRGKKRKAVVDRLAAAIILESYLLYRKNHPEA